MHSPSKSSQTNFRQISGIRKGSTGSHSASETAIVPRIIQFVENGICIHRGLCFLFVSENGRERERESEKNTQKPILMQI